MKTTNQDIVHAEYKRRIPLFILLGITPLVFAGIVKILYGEIIPIQFIISVFIVSIIIGIIMYCIDLSIAKKMDK